MFPVACSLHWLSRRPVTCAPRSCLCEKTGHRVFSARWPHFLTDRRNLNSRRPAGRHENACAPFTVPCRALACTVPFRSRMTPWFVMQVLASPISVAMYITGHQRTVFILQVSGLLRRILAVWGRPNCQPLPLPKPTPSPAPFLRRVPLVEFVLHPFRTSQESHQSRRTPSMRVRGNDLGKLNSLSSRRAAVIGILLNILFHSTAIHEN